MKQEERDKLLRRIQQQHLEYDHYALEDDEEDIADLDDVSVEEVWEIANNTA